ncbi:hypothetical protein [Bacillus sp. USDA818B3_A]|uniref:hypothetical protein n=1 Tax=Bacillus sp. USDA818B3_A TaxID=2698834 RepID=UPI0013696CAA|nr:hypothetical protein [Bacillus sp. USDA818B3_A]
MIVIKMAGGETHELDMSLKDFFNDIKYENDSKMNGFYPIFGDVVIRLENISSIFQIDN